MDRRKAIKLGIGALVAGSVGTTLVNKAFDAVAPKVPDVVDFNDYTFNQFNPFPTNFSYNGKHKHCNVIVHAGFGQKYDKREETNDGYGLYLQNLKGLIKKLDKTDELTIFAIEYRDYRKLTKIPEGCNGFKNSLKIITESTEGKPKKFLGEGQIKTRQTMKPIYSFLEKNRINEVRFAGEQVWKGLSIHAEEACLGELARIFNEGGYKTKGIENCMWPLDKPNGGSELIRSLY